MAKQERSSRTHERFLDASADEFSRHGYAGANLQRIATHVGMTKGALYAHFPSKDALAAVFTSAFDRVVQELLQDIGEDDLTMASLRHVTVGFVLRMQSDSRFRAGIRLAFEEGCTHGRVPSVINNLSDTLTRLIRDAQEKRELTTRQPPELISSLVVALMFGMYYTAAAAGSGDDAEQVCELWQLLSPSDPECSA
ncbi:TetR/AcrR family transcriptional regulator [Streptomyces sp. HNM0663]|uniref:TetR/AcrR family transcriptional regulator n=1 Tax=Streptomyces chengmaiensis TaxID=3040919 RepID=A0ABT6HF42_9ACTN|nr:TetR/AcrR family transcriptional regulator [Streptomyces chengmaiensis]MDH2387382.1 TetR/AcrR family transcriptional regulator [Streptomyces chengmaiensis]